MSYRESQDFIDVGDDLLRQGKPEDAYRSFLRAAELQLEFVRSRPEDRVKTRSVYALSAATLFYQAHDLDRAERVAADFVAQPWLDDYTRIKMRELLTRIWNEMHVHHGSDTDKIQGILRAVDLDKKKLRIEHGDGIATPLVMPQEILDDVIGPMLNHRVQVSLHRPRNRKRWAVKEIELIG